MGNKQKQLINYGDANGDSLVTGLNEELEEARRRQQQETMDRKINEMATKALEFYQSYGKDDYRYQMMITFLDVAFQMKDAIAVLTSVRVATSYLSTAIQFIDDTVNFDEEFDKQLLQKSYGPFANFRRRMRARRAMRNTRRRMMIVIKTISDRLNTAHLITDSLKDGFERMRLTMLRTNEKRRRREEKRAAKNGTALTAPQPTAAEKYIMEMAETHGITEPAPKSGEGGTAPAPSRGIDDILG